MAQKRFIRRGVAKVYYLPTVADTIAGPTRTEIEAGQQVQDWIAGITGFQVTSETVPTPDLGHRFDSGIPGATSVSDSSIQFYDDEAAEEVADMFPTGEEGFLYFMPKGDKPDSPTGQLFATRVASNSPNWTVDMSPAVTDVGFTITAEPVEGLAIPAAAA